MRSLLLVVALVACAAPVSAEGFQPGCALPFASIAQAQAIDTQCGVAGDAAAGTALRAQDSAKNNFCAAGKPVVLTFDAYPGLQQAAAQALGAAYAPPPDRSVLARLFTWRGQKIGEGTLVSLAAFVDPSLHYSDTSAGESVNCHRTGDAANDIHIPLLASPGADECQSVTAEISPHARPAAWSVARLKSVPGPVRITGQLFFDASHRPCAGTTRESPARQSTWEIHPVYALDVCRATTLAQCDAARDADWLALDAWVAGRAQAPQAQR